MGGRPPGLVPYTGQPDLRPFSERLQELRTAAGNPSLRELARLCGVSKSRLGAIENGDANATLDVLLRLQAVFGFASIEELLGDPRTPSARLVRP